MDSPEAPTFDVVVLGSGVAGMAAALFASIRGLSVLVLEKAMVVGGTSALSAGTAWIPRTTHAAKVNPADTRENAERYLRAAVGNRLDPDKLDAFLTHGPSAIAELEAETDETAANLVLGEPAHRPNPCLGPLDTAPFYAIELHPGMNGTSIALVTNQQGQVRSSDRGLIAGLFACGNDMTSMMAGSYPGPGVTIGPAIVFAYVVAEALKD